MNSFSDICWVSLQDARKRTRKQLKENEQCYNSLENKENDYAKVVKSLGDLHRKAYEVYLNAPDKIQGVASE